MEEYEQIRRAYFVEKKSIRAIAKERGHGREVIRKAILSPKPAGYTLKEPRQAPVLGPFKERIDELVAESATLPRKQRYTGHTIFKILWQEGYRGSESGVRRYVGQRRREMRRPAVYVPLEYEPGHTAQVDWGEAVADIAGERQKVQLFVMRLSYSRAKFVMAFPKQKQESFFAGHVAAFQFFGGVPRHITYDNLKTAVYKILNGRNRKEQASFTAFRSYYLFESVYCQPGKGHEKGGVESDIGFSQRNFMSPIPQVESFEQLNMHLKQACLEEMERRMRGETDPIGTVWEKEKPHLLPLPANDYPCYVSRAVKANGYSQVTFETNRYSVPTFYADRPLVLRAYPFHIEVICLDNVIATHARCYDREKDLLDPLHYLELLSERPRAFDQAQPIRRWRKNWPPVYETVLSHLRHKWPDSRGVREFIQILQLHQQYPARLIEKAAQQALRMGCAHYDGILLLLQQLQLPETVPPPLDLQAFPQLTGVGEQPLQLTRYDQLLAGGD